LNVAHVVFVTNYLFIYGTLMPDHAPAEIARAVRKLRRVGNGWTSGRLYDFGEYPGAIFAAQGESKVRGAIYEMQGGMNLLRQLDVYEEFDERHPERSLFLRKKRPIRLDDKRQLLAWVYEYNRDPSTGVAIPKGDYRDHLRRRKHGRTTGV
jgi:gamma-glutamylcyclotransferase (GGCT)/AIG2-like uncharacterized protein YtfP